MDILKNESGILGSASVDSLNESIKEFFKQAAEIRTRLGKQGYLLDKYLSYLLRRQTGYWHMKLLQKALKLKAPRTACTQKY